jgi:pimeloyl-ACP methyl ester carboxylesterase
MADRMQRIMLKWFVFSLILLGGIPAARASEPTTRPLLLHLPGVGGYRGIDRNYLTGLRRGGVEYDIQVYDWTENDTGLDALHGYARNLIEAQHVADLLTARARQYPDSPILMTSHSGGGAIAIWALERLPADVHIQTLCMLAPALSPMYDLTPALRHVTGKVYSFNSLSDQLVLGYGCRFCGTMDGEKTDAAGRVGFSRPKNGDERLYEKLVQPTYEPGWMNLGNFGDHIGPLAPRFAAKVLAPLIRGMTVAMGDAVGVQPSTQPVPADRP